MTTTADQSHARPAGPEAERTVAQLRPVVAELESACMDAGKVLVDAEHEHRLTTRRAVLSGDYGAPDATAAAVAEARKAHEQAKIARDEAAGLLAEAVARERAAEEDEIRDQVSGKVARVAAAASEADTHFAAFVGKLLEAKRLEIEARRLCETGLHQPVYGGGLMTEAIADAAGFLQSLQTFVPAELRAFAGDRAARGVQRIKAAAGI